MAVGALAPRRKLPVQQLAVLSIARFAEPIALTSVFPYLPELIESLDVSKDEVARWAGLTSSVFALTQAVFAVPWGRASDRYGRKPVILICLSGTMLMTVLWGLSRTLAMAITVRAIQGVFNGSVGVIRTTVAEMVPYKELQPRAFSIMPLVWNVGSIFGPMLGGLLANPHQVPPSARPGPEAGLLDRFPYILPNLVAACLFFFGISVGLLFLDESLEAKAGRYDPPRAFGKRLIRVARNLLNRETRRAVDGESGPLLTNAPDRAEQDEAPLAQENKKVALPPPRIAECLTPQTILNLTCYTLLATHNIAFDVLVPLFMHYPRQEQSTDNPRYQPRLRFSGGFGLGNSRIGLLFTVYGIFGMLVQFFIFPPLASRYGVARCLRVCAVGMPLVYLAMPFTALIEDSITQQVVGSILQNVKGVLSTFSFPCSTILLTNSAPSLRILGTLNGVAVSVSAIGRAVGPAVVGLAFTLGVEQGYVVVPWWTLAGMAVIAAVPVFWIVEGEGFGGDEDAIEDTDDEAEDEDGDESARNAEDFPEASLTCQDGEMEAGVEAVENLPSDQQTSPMRTPRRRVSRRVSIPIGLAGMSRRYSSNLGASLGSAGGQQ